MKPIDIALQMVSKKTEFFWTFFVFAWVVWSMIELLKSGVSVYYAGLFGFGLFVIYFSLIMNIIMGYYTPKQLSQMKKNGIKTRMRIEEIELVALFGGFLFAIYIIITSLTKLSEITQELKYTSYMKIFGLGLGAILVYRWIVQNEYNLKVLGDRLDELEEKEREKSKRIIH